MHSTVSASVSEQTGWLSQLFLLGGSIEPLPVEPVIGKTVSSLIHFPELMNQSVLDVPIDLNSTLI